MIDLSIVVPVYCGEHTVTPLFDAIRVALEDRYRYEIIFVHDAGPDDSLRVLTDLQAEFPDIIHVLTLSRNFGQHNALICGFTRVTGRIVVTMDEDLQHDPSEIDRMLVKQTEGNYDVVYGNYDGDRRHNGFRNWTSLIMKRMLAKAIPELHPDYSAFRVMRTPIARAMVEMRNSYTFLDGYISWLTTRVASVPVSHNERIGGRSGYSTKRLIEHAINVFVTFSNYPIRLLLRIAVFVFASTLAYSLYLVIRKVIQPDWFATGYPSLMIISGLGTGIMLLGLGVIGEYVHRVNQKTTQRPNYFLHEDSEKIAN